MVLVLGLVFGDIVLLLGLNFVRNWSTSLGELVGRVEGDILFLMSIVHVLEIGLLNEGLTAEYVQL